MNLEQYFVNIDFEVLENYVVLLYKFKDEEVKILELEEITQEKIKELFANKVIVAHNYVGYDGIILEYILTYPGCDAGSVRNVSDTIIKGFNKPRNFFPKTNSLGVVGADTMTMNRNDLYKKSLKLLQLANNLPHQEFDFTKSTIDSKEEKDILINYAINDVETLETIFYTYCWASIKSRYIALDVVNKMPKFIKETLRLITGSPSSYTSYLFWNGKKPLDSIDYRFNSKKIPTELRDSFKNWKTVGERNVNWLDNVMKLSGGGLHSANGKVKYWRSEGKKRVLDLDATSYYPTLIKNNIKYFPHLDKFIFLKIIEERIRYLNEGNVEMATALKLIINMVYGQLGTKGSNLFGENALLFVCKLGQFQLLVLIHRLKERLKYGFELILSNTDGIMIYVDATVEDNNTLNTIIEEWENEFGQELKAKIYRQAFIRDVLNYVTETIDQKIKGIGIFNKAPLRNITEIKYSRSIVEYMVADIFGTPNGEVEIKPIILTTNKIKKYNLPKKFNKIYVTSKEKGKLLTYATFQRNLKEYSEWKEILVLNNPVYYTEDITKVDRATLIAWATLHKKDCKYRNLATESFDYQENVEIKKEEYRKLKKLYGGEYLSFSQLSNNKFNIEKKKLEGIEDIESILKFDLVGGVKLVPKDTYVVLDIDIPLDKYETYKLTALNPWLEKTKVIRNSNSQHVKYIFYNDLHTSFKTINLDKKIKNKFEIKTGNNSVAIYSFKLEKNISKNQYSSNEQTIMPISSFIEDTKLINAEKKLIDKPVIEVEQSSDNVLESVIMQIMKIQDKYGITFQTERINVERTAVQIEWDEIKTKYRGSNTKLRLYVDDTPSKITLRPYCFSQTGKELALSNNIPWLAKLNTTLNKNLKSNKIRLDKFKSIVNQLHLFEGTHDFQYGNIYHIRTGGKKTLSTINLALKTVNSGMKCIIACNNNENLEANVFDRIISLFKKLEGNEHKTREDMIKYLTELGIGYYHGSNQLDKPELYNLIVTNHTYLFDKGDTTDKYKLRTLMKDTSYFLIIDEVGELSEQFIKNIDITSLYGGKEHRTIRSIIPINKDSYSLFKIAKSIDEINDYNNKLIVADYVSSFRDKLGITKWSLVNELELNTEGEIKPGYLSTKFIYNNPSLELLVENDTFEFVISKNGNDFVVGITEQVYNLDSELEENELLGWIKDKTLKLYKKIVTINDIRYTDLETLLEFAKENGIIEKLLNIKSLFEYQLIIVNKDPWFNENKDRICGSTATLNNVHEYLNAFGLLEPEVTAQNPVKHLDIKVINELDTAKIKKTIEINSSKKILICTPTKREANKLFHKLKLRRFYNGTSVDNTYKTHNSAVYKNTDISYSGNRIMIGQDLSNYEVIIQITDILIPLCGRINNDGIFDLEDIATSKIKQNIGRVLRLGANNIQVDNKTLYLVSNVEEQEKIITKIDIDKLVSPLCDEYVIDFDYKFPLYLDLLYLKYFGIELASLKKLAFAGKFNHIGKIMSETNLTIAQISHIRGKVVKN